MKFCIVGTGRCGSKLLMQILNTHPDVFVYNETHWIPKMHEFFGMGKGYPGEFLRIIEKTYHITGIPVTEIDRNKIMSHFQSRQEITLRSFCDSLGNILASENGGKKHWADKTPDYGPWLGIIKKHWPRCKFIHLVRHGADVAASMSMHPGYKWMVSAGEDSWVPASYNQYYKAVPIVEKPLEDYIALWYRRFMKIRKAVPNVEKPLEDYAALWYRRLMRIRDEATSLDAGCYKEFNFESFATEPKNLLKQIAEHAELDVTEAWLSRALEGLQVNRIQSRIAHRRLDFLGEREVRLLKDLGYE